MDESAALAIAIERIDLLMKVTLGLQDENARLTQIYTDYRDIARASTMESITTISRYRDALEQIVEMPVGACEYEFTVEPCDCCNAAHDIARAALDGNT